MYIQKRKADNRGIDHFKIILITISMLMFIAFMIFEYLAIIHEELQYEVIAYGLFGGGLVIMAGLLLYESFRNSRNRVFRIAEHLRDALD